MGPYVFMLLLSTGMVSAIAQERFELTLEERNAMRLDTVSFTKILYSQGNSIMLERLLGPLISDYNPLQKEASFIGQGIYLRFDQLDELFGYKLSLVSLENPTHSLKVKGVSLRCGDPISRLTTPLNITLPADATQLIFWAPTFDCTLEFDLKNGIITTIRYVQAQRAEVEQVKPKR